MLVKLKKKKKKGMGRNKQTFELFDKKKKYNFDKALTPFWNTFL